MSDMLKVIEPKSDQINAEDLIGRDMTIVITGVQVRAGTEQPVSMKFEGSEKVFRPCKTVSRIIVAAWGADTSKYIGRAMTLYRDPAVKWAGMAVGKIRVKAISHIDQPLKLALAESKQNRKITVVQPLQVPVGGKEQTEDRAANWAAGFLRHIGKVDSIDALVAFQEQHQPRIDELRTKRPDLADDITAALLDRKNHLAPEEPQTGRSDEQHGDQFPDDDF